ncbi:MAG: hypothetical protein B6I35_04490 [Anaerolineaceae bacterium 4572_32.2]|nr:MAG: hypothetical protein B6I35_04490 [Anaerolineaceae bacterium 4572_32.2]
MKRPRLLLACLLAIYTLSGCALSPVDVITKFHSHGRWIELRHLPILGHRVYIRLQPKRYECLHCVDKTTTQALDWYETKSPHTKSYRCCALSAAHASIPATRVFGPPGVLP